MKHLLTYGGYLIALIIAGLALALNNLPTAANNGSVEISSTLNSAESPPATAEQFEQAYAAKKAELAILESELVSIYAKSAEISKEEYARIQQEAEQRVSEELNPKQQSDVDAMMAAMDRAMEDEGRIRLTIETRISAFLRELDLPEETYNQIIDQLVANRLDTINIRKQWRAGLLEDDKATALLKPLNQRTALSQFLNEQQMQEYQKYLDKEGEKLLLTLAKNNIARAAPDISNFSREILQSKLIPYFALDRADNENASQFFERRNNLLLQIEADIASQLNGEDLLAAGRVVENIRLSAKRSLGREDSQ